MDRYFSEATDADIKAFSQHDKFKTEDGFDMSIIADTVIRTKITLINNSGVLDNETSLLKKAAEDVGFELKTYNENGVEKILIPTTKKEVKLLLTFLDEDIFIAAISKIRFKSNSKRPMK
ncbi:Uncharacterised protein [Serratia rubidaea]|uniref:Uncharacterized protein n=2 Tax=Serratia rubidaea TaxID=61652 RepID=A0A4U9HJ02_SERRU|nr:Uncharacterised protein [Serratia rubidaea]